MATDAKPSDTKSKTKVVLKIELTGDEDPLKVKVKLSTKWSKIFQSFADYKGRQSQTLKYLYDGNVIQQHQTVGDIIDEDDIDDDEIQIDVMYEQLGG